MHPTSILTLGWDQLQKAERFETYQQLKIESRMNLETKTHNAERTVKAGNY